VNACSPKCPESVTWIAGAATAVLLISGCAAPRSALLPEIDSWDTRARVLADLDKWEFSGRIAVKTESDGFNGKLRWLQDQENYRATVSGPLGVGTLRLEGDDQSVVMTDKDGVRTELDDAELELRQRHGWTIPIASLRYWALGIPERPSSRSTARGGSRVSCNVTGRFVLRAMMLGVASRCQKYWPQKIRTQECGL